jgi:hypothetical protein
MIQKPNLQSRARSCGPNVAKEGRTLNRDTSVAGACQWHGPMPTCRISLSFTMKLQRAPNLSQTMSSGGGPPRGVGPSGQGSHSGLGLDSFEARLKALQGPVPEALPLSEVERRLAVRQRGCLSVKLAVCRSAGSQRAGLPRTCRQPHRVSYLRYIHSTHDALGWCWDVRPSPVLHLVSSPRR